MNDEDALDKRRTLFQRWFHRPRTPAPPDVGILAEQGNPDAQFHLGLKFASGDGSAQDMKQAAKWYQQAAEQNHPLAQFNLGAMYAFGQGVRRDEGAARVWFGKAAEQGDAGAQYRLGQSLYRSSVPRTALDRCESRIEAYKWFALAAEQNYRNSEAARDTVALQMTRADVKEATRRAGAFIRSLPSSPKDQ